MFHCEPKPFFHRQQRISIDKLRLILDDRPWIRGRGGGKRPGAKMPGFAHSHQMANLWEK